MTQEIRTINVPQNDYKVASGEDCILTTILGSCVATCLWDGKSGVGGMNHILLPSTRSLHSPEVGESVNLMEMLINEIIKNGGIRKNLKAKIFGGSSMFDRGGGVGEMNQTFTLWFLENEGIEVISKSVGGNKGRKVKFSPHNGAAQMKFLQDDWNEGRIQENVRTPKVVNSHSRDVTLF